LRKWHDEELTVVAVLWALLGGKWGRHGVRENVFKILVRKL
jgi:hypothetical protein